MSIILGERRKHLDYHLTQTSLVERYDLIVSEGQSVVIGHSEKGRNHSRTKDEPQHLGLRSPSRQSVEPLRL
jgi:hypothetical protein